MQTTKENDIFIGCNVFGMYTKKKQKKKKRSNQKIGLNAIQKLQFMFRLQKNIQTYLYVVVLLVCTYFTFFFPPNKNINLFVKTSVTNP